MGGIFNDTSKESSSEQETTAGSFGPIGDTDDFLSNVGDGSATGTGNIANSIDIKGGKYTVTNIDQLGAESLALATASLDASVENTFNVLALADDALEINANLAGGAIQTIQDVNSQSLAFASAAQDDAFTFTAGAFDDALDFAFDNAEQSFTFVGEALNNTTDAFDSVLAANQESNEQAFEFSAGAFNSALGAARSSFGNALSTTEQIAANAISNANSTAKTSIQAQRETLYDSLTFIGEGVTESNKFLNDTTERAIDAVITSTKTESAQSLDKVIKMAGMVMGVLTVGFVAMQFAGRK